MSSSQQGHPFLWSWALVTPFGWLVWIGLIPAVLWLFRFLGQQCRGKALYASLILCGVALSLVHVGVYLVSGNALWRVVTGSDIPVCGTDSQWLLVEQTFLSNFLALALMGGGGVVFEQRFRSHRSELESERLRGDLGEAQLALLRQQLQPHFLFNAHNAINTLILKGDAARASDMLESLSEFLRNTLALGDRQWVSLGLELDLVRSYCAVQKARFADRLEIAYDLDPAILGHEVPALLLQPIVENSIKHGISAIDKTGTILISAKPSKNGIVLSVTDNGPGLKEGRPRLGIGFNNVKERLKRLYRDSFEIDWGNRTPSGFFVRLALPEKTSA